MFDSFSFVDEMATLYNFPSLNNLFVLFVGVSKPEIKAISQRNAE